MGPYIGGPPRVKSLHLRGVSAILDSGGPLNGFDGTLKLMGKWAPSMPLHNT